MELKKTLHSFTTMTDEERHAFFLEEGDALLQQMLLHIGSPDAELRDQLIYRSFVTLLSGQYLNSTQLQYLFDAATSESYLFKQIGENDGDSVFTRSFSALLVAGILAKDAELLVLEEEGLNQFFKKIGRYLLQEKDLRGFVEGKGWAHSIAHGADLASTTIKHPKFNLQYAPFILHALKLVAWKDHVFVNDEEERLVTIIESLLLCGYLEESLIEWVEQVFDQFEMHLLTQGYNSLFFSGRTCTLNIMKTLYFALKMNNQAPKLQTTLYGQIAKWLKLGS